MFMILPYSRWKPAVSVEDVFAERVGLSEIKVDSGKVYWLELQADGRYIIVKWDGKLKDVTPAGYNVRTRVHEYGGGAWTVNGESVYFVNFGDQRLYHQSIETGKISALTAEDGSVSKYASLVASDHYLFFVYEIEKAPENTNYLACIDLQSKKLRILARGSDFYGDPCLYRDQIGWLEWDHPHMPWDETRLMVGTFDGMKVKSIKQIARGKGVAVCQPKFSPRGKLHFVMDKAGMKEQDILNWWNIYAYDGKKQAVTKELAEYGEPHWVFGQSTYDYIGEKIVAVRKSQGKQELRINGGKVKCILNDFFYISADRKYVYAIAGSGMEGICVARISNLGKVTILRKGSEVAYASKNISEAQHIAVGKGYGYLYLPKNSIYRASEGDMPPLLVKAHGGPTAATSPVFSLLTQFWTSAGFAILDVNYRGSTGYGRRFRDSLLGEWGVVDAEDVANGVQELVRKKIVDGSKVVVRGGSAGGYMVQRVLTQYPNLFAAGASYFGIGDLITLVQGTHKFESRYIDNLVGVKLPKGRALYRDRSPVHHLDQLKSPMIIFQGSDDKIVTPDNSRDMAAILKKKGIPYEYHEYAGEAHGFRKKKNNIDSLKKEMAFYRKVFTKIFK